MSNSIRVSVFVGFLVLQACKTDKNRRGTNDLAENAVISICLDFGSYPDDTPIISPFKQAGFTVESDGQLFVNATGQKNALQFESSGMSIGLPKPVNQVKLSMASYNTDFKVWATSEQGKVLDSATVQQNRLKDFYLIGKGIERVVFHGGGNEGVLQEICVDLYVKI